MIGVRVNYPITSDFDFGVSLVTDINQNAGFKDSDGDNTPDFADMFPNIDGWITDTDGDGLPDQLNQDPDIDGDGWDVFDDCVIAE